MSLLTQANADLRAILGDATGGFAQPITITNPDGVAATINGQATLIGTTIDPQTGMLVAGRKASVALAIDALETAKIGQPCGASDGARKPWLVQFTTPTGKAQKFKVTHTLPDELGVIVCMLETYR